jgi:hypothetical protein
VSSLDKELDGRSERIVRNEISLRRVNEAIEAGRRTRDGLVPFLCECGLLGCNEVIELTLDAYEDVRRDGARFVVLPGHRSEVDVLVENGGGYDVVAKREGAPAAYARQADPRSPGGPE